jgi:hypothetical protein
LGELDYLNLYHTLVSETVFGTLRDALPDCEIVWEKESALPNRRRS